MIQTNYICKLVLLMVLDTLAKYKMSVVSAVKYFFINFYLFYVSREMTSEDLKLRENALKDLYCPDKTLPKVKKKDVTAPTL